MANLTILFNDSFAAGKWSAAVGYEAGNQDATVVNTLSDGRLETLAHYAGADANAKIRFTQAAGNPTFDTVAVARSSGLVGKALRLLNPANNAVESPVGADERLFKGGNDLFRFAPAFADFAQFGGLNLAGSPGYQIEIPLGAATASMALLFVGKEHRVNAYYPRGWKPPMFGEWEDAVKLSNNGNPCARHKLEKPAEVVIPMKWQTAADTFGTLTELVERMQREMFVLRFGDGAEWRERIGYCWLKDADQPAYVSPGLLDVTLRVEGFFRYA